MAQIGSLSAHHPQKSRDWQKNQDDIERSRTKIANALKDAKDRSKKNVNLGDDIDTKFNQLQLFGIKLMDMLRESGVDQRRDWLELTEKMCNLLEPLAVASPFTSSSEERNIRQREMMELTLLIGRKLLFEGKHHQAVPAAIQSLKFSIDVHGLNSVNLVPSYLILAEANIGLGKFTQADEYLAQAEWTVMKSPDAKDSVRSKLFRNMGLLHAAKGDYDNALRMLAEDVVNIWHDYLCEAAEYKASMEEEANAFGPIMAQTEQKIFLDQAQEAEAIQTLCAVLDMRDQSPRRQPAVISKICLTLAMLFYILDDINKAKEYGSKARFDKVMNGESSDSAHNFLHYLEKRS